MPGAKVIGKSGAASQSKLYSKVIKHKVLGVGKKSHQEASSCVLLFGPSDASRVRKESHLLSSDLSVNLALKTAKEFLTSSSPSKQANSCKPLLYCSVLQIYLDEVTDLMQLP